MSVQVFQGVIQELGSGNIAAQVGLGHSMLSYLEFTDGRILHRVDFHGGLAGKLDTAVDQGHPVELHALQRGKRWTVFALRGPDGKLYATQMDQHIWLFYGLVGLLSFLGLILLPLFGLGIIFLVFAGIFLRAILKVKKARKHLDALPGVIYLD